MTTHVWDSPSGDRWRGGIVISIEHDVATIVVLAEAGSPVTYHGPAAGVSVRMPVVVRMTGAWPYQIAELRPGAWASRTDAWRAAQSEAGLFSIVNPDEILGLVREPPPVPPAPTYEPTYDDVLYSLGRSIDVTVP